MPHAGRPHQSTSPEPAGDNADQRAFPRAVRPQKTIQARAEGERHPGQSLFGFRLTLSAAVQQRCGQQIGFTQIVQFQLHGRDTLSLFQKVEIRMIEPSSACYGFLLYT